MANSDTRKITSEMRRTCLKLAVDSADTREHATDVVSRALVYEQYLSGEVGERMAASQAESELAEAGIKIIEGDTPS